MAPTRQSVFEARIAPLGGARATAQLLHEDYGGLTAITWTCGVGSGEEAGGDTLAVDITSDEYEVRAGTIEVLDTSGNEAKMIAATGFACATGRRALLWLAEPGTGTGQTPSAREYGPLEVAFGGATLTVTGGVDGGGAWTYAFDQHGATPAFATIA